MRDELSPPNGKEEMNATCYKHMEKQQLYIYKAATANGWWGIGAVFGVNTS